MVEGMNGQNSLEADGQLRQVASLAHLLLHVLVASGRSDLMWCCRVMAGVVLLGTSNGRMMEGLTKLCMPASVVGTQPALPTGQLP